MKAPPHRRPALPCPLALSPPATAGCQGPLPATKAAPAMSEFYLEPAEVSFSSVTGARAAAQLREELKQVKIHVFAGIKPVAAKQPAAPGPAAAGTLHLNPAAQKVGGQCWCLACAGREGRLRHPPVRCSPASFGGRPEQASTGPVCWPHSAITRRLLQHTGAPVERVGNNRIAAA